MYTKIFLIYDRLLVNEYTRKILIAKTVFCNHNDQIRDPLNLTLFFFTILCNIEAVASATKRRASESFFHH